jgi:hypothetical protein
MSMEDLEQPLSPSDAARILAGQRWDRDQAHERGQPEQPAEVLTGKRATELGQGWSELPVANPIPKESGEAIDGSELSEALRSTQAQVAEPIPVQYIQQKGENAGQAMDEHLSVSPEQAAHDLSQFRNAISESQEAQLNAELAKAIDELRGAGDQQQAQPVELQPQPPQPEAQVQPQAPAADDEMVRLLQNNPKLLDAINKELGQHSAQADQIAQRYVQATTANANAAYANLLVSFPEVANVPASQLGTALRVLAQSQPEKAQAITRHVETVTRLTQEAQRAQQAAYWAQQHQVQQDFNRTSKVADGEFEAWAKTQDGPERIKEISDHALHMLRESMTDEQINANWNSNPVFRSALSQRVLYQAAKYELSQKGIAAKAVPPPVPKVMRPGAGSERASESEYQFRSLDEKINRTSGREQIRAAAELIAARRARR